MKKTSVANRVAIGFAAVLVLLVLVGVSGLYGLNRQHAEVNAVLQHDLAFYTNSIKAQIRQSKMRRDEKDILVSLGHDEQLEDYKGKWLKSIKNVEESLEELAQLAASDDERKSVEQAQGRLKSYQQQMLDVYTQMKSGTYPNAHEANEALEPAKKTIQGLQTYLNGQQSEGEKRIKAIDGQLQGIKKQITTLVLTLSAIAAAFGVLAAWLIIRSIRTPLVAMQDAVLSIERSGDLGRRMPVVGHDEIGATSHAVNTLLEGMGQVIGAASKGANQLLDDARRLNEAADRVSRTSEMQATAASSTAAAVEELAVSVNHIADNSRTLEEDTRGAANAAGEGALAAKQTADEIRQIAETIQESSMVIGQLSLRSNEIGGIALVIKEIADQTNLLALNAAIEAARAGETGRGFAVVADEVRKLAERTTDATVQITSKINAVQQDTGTAVSTMNRASEMVLSGVEHTNSVAQSLQEIETLARNNANHISSISVAIQEQSAASQEIARNIERIVHSTEENSEIAGTTHGLSADLSSLAENLSRTINRFRV